MGHHVQMAYLVMSVDSSLNPVGPQTVEKYDDITKHLLL